MKAIKFPNYTSLFPLWEITIGMFLRNLLFFRASLAMACGWNSNNYLKIYKNGTKR